MNNIIQLLLDHEYTENSDEKNNFRSFYKKGYFSVDINKDNAILTNTQGDEMYISMEFKSVIEALIIYQYPDY